MAERRSINEALNLTPEKLAFIKQEPRLEAVHRQNEVVDEPTTTVVAKSPVEDTTPAANDVATHRLTHQARRSADKSPLYTGALVPLTTRLQAETATALRRAYLERKLDGYVNATQQEIVEEAICHWLGNHGYL